MRLRVDSGFSLVETLVASTIAVVLALGATSLVIEASKYQSQLGSRAGLETVRQNIMVVLASEKAWKHTILKNSGNMNCLANMTPCTTNGGEWGPPIRDREFDLYKHNPLDPSASAYVATSNASDGFTMAGQRCSQFSLSGNDDCPFKYKLTWTAVCQAGNCKAPQIKINAKLIYSPSRSSQSKSLNFDVNRYSITDYYVNNLSVQNCIPKVQVFDKPGSYPFQVPNDYSYMLVEVWGGGGGGAAALATYNGCIWAPGTQGQASYFGGVGAAGGAAGDRMLQGGYHVHNWCAMTSWGVICGQFSFGSCNGNGQTYVGGNGETLAPVLTGPGYTLPSSMASCLNGLPQGTGIGGQTYGAWGMPGGGGGAGSSGNFDHAYFFLPSGIVEFAAYTPGGMGAHYMAMSTYWVSLPRFFWWFGWFGGGGYWVTTYTAVMTAGRGARAEFTPTTLARGTPLTVTVGAGGVGGNVWGRTGGNGANGYVKIVYW